MENSMSMLVPRLDFVKTESPLGFAARLAAFHVGSRTRPFLCDIGVNLLFPRSWLASLQQKLSEKSPCPSRRGGAL